MTILEEWKLENHISKTEMSDDDQNFVRFVDHGDAFQPMEIDIKPNHSNLDFVFDKGVGHHLNSYFLQVKAQAEKIQKASTKRYLQNVHGYFPLSNNFPTKLILSTSWDPTTVQDDKVYFYRINSDTCQPENPSVRYIISFH